MPAGCDGLDGCHVHDAGRFLFTGLLPGGFGRARRAEEARKVYTETAAAYVLSRSAPLAEGFVFQLPQEDTNFKDTTTIAGAMVRQTAGKVKDALT